MRLPVQVVGRRLDPDDHRLRDFLTGVAQPHDWLEADSPAAERLLRGLNLADARMSTTTCGHFDQNTVTALPEPIAGCEECLEIGSRWVHLRMCMSCGKSNRGTPSVTVRLTWVDLRPG